MSVHHASRRALPCVSAVVLTAILALPAHASDEEPDPAQDRRAPIVVNGKRIAPEFNPATSATIDRERIETTVNAVNVEDTLRYLPSLVVRKRHIGDTQAPLATRTSGLGSSARSLIYADGILLSALIGNNNGSASPRWGLVSPDEIARIDVLYGPFSAAYPGNSIGGVVNIATREPERLEASLAALTSVQQFDLYGTHGFYPSRQVSARVADRFGAASVSLSGSVTESRSHPLGFVVANRPAASSASGATATGGYDALSRTRSPIRVLGASGLESQRQANLKLKLGLDLGRIRLGYVGGVFFDDTDAASQSYIFGANGPLYSGAFNSAGYAYNLAASAFSGGVYTRQSRHIAQALSAKGDAGDLSWEVIGSSYAYDRDVQRSPSGALPAAAAGGAGQIVRMDGTGWRMLDGKMLWRSDSNQLSVGLHADRISLENNRYATTDWVRGGEGQRNLVSRGKTRTLAVWAQDAFDFSPSFTATIGGRYESWRAYDGYNYALAPALDVRQPERKAERFSPKASIEWRPSADWSVRLSGGRAYRFPTVGELYQTVTTGVTLSVPDPSLRPERATSEELAVEHRLGAGTARVSLFNEIVDDALISQAAPLVAGSPTLYSYVQNVERTRARGVEAAVDWHGLLPRLDLQASATYTDADIRRNSVVPASVGKMLPSVPRWKASAVLSWRADDQVTLTGAARYASRNWGTIDNSDVVGNTWQGFYRYLVFDARAHIRAGQHYSFALGVDNLTNQRYFLFHPFPQRSFTAEVKLTL